MKKMKNIRKHILLVSASLVSTLALTAVMINVPASAATANLPTSCYDAQNEVVWCGVSNVFALQHVYKFGDGHNTAASIQAIYSYFGITQSDINNMSSSAVVGKVYKNGDVVVNGKVVATRGVTAGRQYIAGSTKVIHNGVTFYKRTPSISFTSNALDAFVVFHNGRFSFAILSSCGNSVVAVPVAALAPSPEPTPVPAPSPASLPKPTKLPNYTIQKQVSIAGTNNWSSEIEVHPDTNVDYKIVITSTGGSNANNINVKDTLPSDDNYDPGTLTINGNIASQSDINNFFASGYNISTLAPGSIVTIIFEATAGENRNNANCTNETLSNVATMQGYNLPQESSTATVSVVCVPTAPTTSTTIRPSTLANTGPGSTIGIFVATALVGAISYGVFAKRRLYRK